MPLRLQAGVVVASVVGFWPWFSTTTQQGLTIPVDTNAEVVSFVSVVSLALLLPLLLDWAVEVVGRLVVADLGVTIEKNEQFHLNDVEKATLFVGLALTPAVALASDPFLCPSCTAANADFDFGTLYFTAARCQIVAVVGTLWVSLHRLDPTVWTRWSTALGVAVLTAAVNINSGPQQLYGQGSADADASCALLAVAMLGLVVPAARWLHKTVPKMWKKTAEKEDFNPTLGNTGDEPNPSRLVFPAAYVVIGTVSSVAILLMAAVSSSRPLDTFKVVVYLAFFGALEVAMLFYLKLIELESIYHLAEVLQSKKAFMRYTAHEIRTPLNAATLGVKLLLTTLNGVAAQVRPCPAQLALIQALM